ncbi:MAG: LpxD N-terminal domain-containing protein, partial [Candidatus Binatia bacterium]
MKLSDIAHRLGCELQEKEEVEISGVKGIDEAGVGDLTFVANAKYLAKLPATKAAAVILSLDAPAVSLPSLRTANPY